MNTDRTLHKVTDSGNRNQERGGCSIQTRVDHSIVGLSHDELSEDIHQQLIEVIIPRTIPSF